MWGREVIQQSRWIIVVQWRDGDVDDASRAIEGFLERVQANIVHQRLQNNTKNKESE